MIVFRAPLFIHVSANGRYLSLTLLYWKPKKHNFFLPWTVYCLENIKGKKEKNPNNLWITQTWNFITDWQSTFMACLWFASSLPIHFSPAPERRRFFVKVQYMYWLSCPPPFCFIAISQKHKYGGDFWHPWPLFSPHAARLVWSSSSFCLQLCLAHEFHTLKLQHRFVWSDKFRVN